MTIQTPQVTQILRVNTQKTIRMCSHKKKKISIFRKPPCSLLNFDFCVFPPIT